jgi:hypothetical protein
MDQDQNPGSAVSFPPAIHGHGLRRVEHYALYFLNGMAAAGSSCLSDEDIDMAIDTAERLANRLLERGHIKSHE